MKAASAGKVLQGRSSREGSADVRSAGEGEVLQREALQEKARQGKVPQGSIPRGKAPPRKFPRREASPTKYSKISIGILSISGP